MLYLLLFVRLCRAVGKENRQELKGNNTEPFILYRDNQYDIDELIFGEIPKFQDLFLPPENMDFEDNEEPDIEEDDADRFLDLPIKLTDFEPIKSRATLDVKDFNDLGKSFLNLTRRYWGAYWRGYTDPADAPQKLEFEKRYKVDNITLQFLIHARYHIKKSIVQKEEFRYDTRYQMGFLFNRLRRIRYEQLKLVSVMEEHIKSDDWTELKATLRFYEKIVRCDVDLKDTITLIKAIDKEDQRLKEAAMTTTAKPGVPSRRP